MTTEMAELEKLEQATKAKLEEIERTREQLKRVKYSPEAEAETARRELADVEKARGEVVATLDTSREALRKMKKSWDKVVVEYAEALLKARELNDTGQRLAEKSGKRFETIDLSRGYGYAGAITPSAGIRGCPDLATHEDITPAIFGGDIQALINAKKDSWSGKTLTKIVKGECK